MKKEALARLLLLLFLLLAIAIPVGALWVYARPAARAVASSVVGPLAITVLFAAVSVPMMDRHMRARHPGYGQRR